MTRSGPPNDGEKLDYSYPVLQARRPGLLSNYGHFQVVHAWLCRRMPEWSNCTLCLCGCSCCLPSYFSAEHSSGGIVTSALFIAQTSTNPVGRYFIWRSILYKTVFITIQISSYLMILISWPCSYLLRCFKSHFKKFSLLRRPNNLNMSLNLL